MYEGVDNEMYSMTCTVRYFQSLCHDTCMVNPHVNVTFHTYFSTDTAWIKIL